MGIQKIKKIFLIFGILIFLTANFSNSLSFAQTATPTDTPTPTPSSSSDTSQGADQLQSEINDLESKISNLQGQEQTLSSQIDVMDSQIKLTEYKIEQTKEQILSLEEDIDTAQKKVTSLESSLSNLTKVLLGRVVAGYEVGSQNQFQVLLASSTISDFFSRANYLRIVEHHDKVLAYDTVQAKDDYANQQQIFENEKQQVIALSAQLESYTQDLDTQKAAKQQLLTETQGDEANYEEILAQTKAQLASFQGFVSSRGGAGLLSNQTVCDDWGCYYNQRDSQWGGMALNGTSYSLADSGCLLTSMAMVYTHYGHKDVNPISINSVSSNFDGIPAALLKFSVTANGVTAQRMSADIDSTLASGNPVIIGISYDGGPLPDHFVVLVSGSNGNYIMNDPYTPNGHNISFRGTYPSVRIVEEDRVSI